MIEELNMIYDELNSSNVKKIEHFETELSKIRAGKASPSMLSGVMVEYYEAMTPLQQVANVSVMDARTLTVQPWEKSMLDEITKSIINANLGLNPQIDGQLIRLPVPELNEERRTELKKLIKSIGEKCKVAIRNIRREANEDLKKLLKDKAISEDDEKSNEKKVQTITDEHINSVDEKVSLKEKEIMTI